MVSRNHRVLKVFSGNDQVPELSILGTGEMEFKNGKTINSPFACHVKLDSSDPTAGVRISFMQVFAVRFHPHIILFDHLTLIYDRRAEYGLTFCNIGGMIALIDSCWEKCVVRKYFDERLQPAILNDGSGFRLDVQLIPQG